MKRLIPSKFRLFLIIVCLSNVVSATAQTTARRAGGSRSAVGTLKVQVPSGVVGDRYWIYVNGRLLSFPPHGTPQKQLFIIMLPDGSGSWEGFNSEGRAVSSARLDEYLRTGDKYGIFHAVEFKVEPGTYDVEILVPSPLFRSFPYLGSTRTGISVRSGSTAEVYASVPVGWSEMPFPVSAAFATGYSLCPPGGPFDIGKRSEALLKWGMDYRNDPLRQSLLRAVAAYRPGDRTVIVDVDSKQREVDGDQVQAIVGGFLGPPYSRGDIAYCRERLPQYSSAFQEFEATIESVERDRESFRKLAEDLKAAR